MNEISEIKIVDVGKGNFWAYCDVCHKPINNGSKMVEFLEDRKNADYSSAWDYAHIECFVTKHKKIISELVESYKSLLGIA